MGTFISTLITQRESIEQLVPMSLGPSIEHEQLACVHFIYKLYILYYGGAATPFCLAFQQSPDSSARHEPYYATYPLHRHE